MAASAPFVSGVTDLLRRNRLPLLAALVALVVVVLAALVAPVGLGEEGARAGRSGVPNGPTSETLQQEDLGAYLASDRWGVNLKEILDQEAAEAAAAARAAAEIEMTRELARIGFVGLMVEPGEYAVLLVLPDGRVSRLAGGDTLPDGRTLVSVSGNSLTLEGSDGQRDLLPLFPRVPRE